MDSTPGRRGKGDRYRADKEQKRAKPQSFCGRVKPLHIASQQFNFEEWIAEKNNLNSDDYNISQQQMQQEQDCFGNFGG
jgi:hypothetical protein